MGTRLVMDNGRQEIIIFCDGGNRLKTTNYSAFSSVVITDDMEEVNETYSITKSFKGATNNQMELLGFLSTLVLIFENYHHVNPNTNPMVITVVSDSQYLVKGVNEYMKDWIARGWKTYAKKPVKNMEIWKAIHHLINLPYERGVDLFFNFLWTKGHVKIVDGNGDYSTFYNNMCDDRLNEAMDNHIVVENDYEEYLKDILERVYNL